MEFLTENWLLSLVGLAVVVTGSLAFKSNLGAVFSWVTSRVSFPAKVTVPDADVAVASVVPVPQGVGDSFDLTAFHVRELTKMGIHNKSSAQIDLCLKLYESIAKSGLEDTK